MFANLFARKKVARSYNHSPQFVATRAQVPDCIGEEYTAGTPLLDLSIKYDCDVQAIRKKLAALHVPIKRPRVLGFRHGPKKLTIEQVKWILEQDLRNVEHATIAREVNVTRERVRQICLANGHQNRRARQTKTLEVRERKAANRASYLELVQELSRQYKAGASLSDLQEILGLKDIHGAQSRIGYYRKNWPELFPHRNTKIYAHRILPTEEKQKRAREISEAWIGNVPVEEIARRFDFKNAKSAYAGVYRLRYSHPELFPSRTTKGNVAGVAMSERRALISEMWKKGESVMDIGRAIGYRCHKSVSQFVCRERKQFPEMFPRRA